MTTDMELNFGKPVPKAEPGSYPAILVGIDPFVINEGTAEAKTLMRWDFSLDGIEDPETPGMNLILDGVTSLATGPRSKMRAWVTPLLGRELDEALSLSALRSQLVGKPCLVAVEINESGYSKVANVIAPARTPAKPATPAKPVAGDFNGAPVTPPLKEPVTAEADLDNLPF